MTRTGRKSSKHMHIHTHASEYMKQEERKVSKHVHTHTYT